MMTVVAVPAAEAGQARVTGAALVDDGSTISAVAGEAILAPRQIIDNRADVTIDPNLNADNLVTSLDLEFTIGFDNGAPVFRPLLEEAIANTLFDSNGDPVFEQESDIISLVENFGGVNSPLGQAEITGAAALDTDNIVSAIAGQAELARGQLLGDLGNNNTIVINPSVSGEILEQLDIDFGFGSRGRLNLLEGAIAETVNNANFNRNSDIISLVKAFTKDSEEAVSSEQVLGLD
ncbi:MAG: hypothetical protein RI580_17890 [Halothece sp. Uz-M2-17]|nr:hypothetical protein [Halothece sp. Uz-M2-17]